MNMYSNSIPYRKRRAAPTPTREAPPAPVGGAPLAFTGSGDDPPSPGAGGDTDPPRDPPRPRAYTVCFCGTGCSRDEGEVDRYWDYKLIGWLGKQKARLVSPRAIYDPDTGYIPVRIHLDITGDLRGTAASVTVRGVGENDWFDQQAESDPLVVSGPITVPEDLSWYAGGRSQRLMSGQVTGRADVALALHAANLAARQQDAAVYNFIGHSRGAVESIMAAWFLYSRGIDTPVNIFAIDPVPGTGAWYPTMTQLPPNVASYVGVYAWDHLDSGFSALIPRPNARMIGSVPPGFQPPPQGRGDDPQILAEDQLADPLGPVPDNAISGVPLGQPANYVLYACRGRHGTVAGNTTIDGRYVAADASPRVAPVPRLVYKLARAYLSQWGTVFAGASRVDEGARSLRQRIHTDHEPFDAMAGGPARTGRSDIPLSRGLRQYVRQVSSSSGRNFLAKSYLEDVAGDPPFKLFFPCTADRVGGGWVKWFFL